MINTPGVSHPSGKVDTSSTAGTFATENGSILTIYSDDINTVDAVLYTCCTLVGVYLVCYSGKGTNC